MFSHEFVEGTPEEYTTSLNAHKTAKKKRTVALNNLKSNYKDEAIYNAYMTEKANTDLKYKDHLAVKEDIKFLGFQDFQQFLGEFNWAFGLLLYSLFNLGMAMSKRKKKNKGVIILHAVFIYISLYFITWSLFTHDFSKTTYVVTSILLTLITIYATDKLFLNFLTYLNTREKRLKFMLREAWHLILTITPEIFNTNHQREAHDEAVEKVLDKY